jgi:hypothetical protein
MSVVFIAGVTLSAPLPAQVADASGADTRKVPNETVTNAVVFVSRLAVVDVSLVRGSARIIEGEPGRITLKAVNSGFRSRASEVTLKVDKIGETVRIRSQYPARSRYLNVPRECVAPEDDRGDFYGSDVAIQVVLTIPAGTKLRVRLLAGDVVANAPRSDLDIQTNTGRISLLAHHIAFESSVAGGHHVIALPNVEERE